jgi:hypothetical protein
MAGNRKSEGSWLLGLLALLGPYLLLELVAPTSVSVWARVYIAGAVGGLCFELIRNRWRLEMPSSAGAGRRSAEPTFAPLGPLADVGFLGRMLTGAVAAPTFIAIISVLDASDTQQSDLPKYLESLATRPDTLAWGVAAGFAAPAVWDADRAVHRGAWGRGQLTPRDHPEGGRADPPQGRAGPRGGEGGARCGKWRWHRHGHNRPHQRGRDHGRSNREDG